MENTINEEKSMKIEHILIDKRTTWEKILDPLFQSKIGLIKPKQPPHASVPLGTTILTGDGW